MASTPNSDDYSIALIQYVKAKRAEVRLTYSLMADAEILRNLSKWREDFALHAQATCAPSVLDIESEFTRRKEALNARS